MNPKLLWYSADVLKVHVVHAVHVGFVTATVTAVFFSQLHASDQSSTLPEAHLSTAVRRLSATGAPRCRGAGGSGGMRRRCAGGGSHGGAAEFCLMRPLPRLCLTVGTPLTPAARQVYRWSHAH